MYTRGSCPKFPSLNIQSRGKIQEIGPGHVNLHKILGGFGLSYALIVLAVLEKNGTVIKGFSFIVMVDFNIVLMGLINFI